MKFSDKHPNATDDDQFEHHGDYVICLAVEKKPCVQCRELTHFVTLSFETWVCSEECLDELWDEFAEAYSQEIFD